ncbi:hypothetical protein FOA52_014617 [Chlamydomonas sp. UWO 241]|nr:hypothetical protein FOA52_014617 [Chlamydomonas sp. UWO 241]
MSPRPSLHQATAAAKALCVQVVEAAKHAKAFPDECNRLAKFAKRLHPLMDDIEQGAPTIAPDAAARGVHHVQELRRALERSHAAITSTVALGPFYALVNDRQLSSEFANCCVDIADALKKLPLTELSADEFTEDVSLSLQQLRRVCVDFGASAQRTAVLGELRIEAESLRSGRAGSRPLPTLDLTQGVLRGCTYAQLGSDLEFLRQAHGAAVARRDHVDAFFYAQLVLLEEPLVPQGKSAAKLKDHTVAAAALPKAATAAREDEYAPMDPVQEVRTLLDKVQNPKFTLEQRLATLQPLAAAAGLAPPVPGSSLHGGAVLFALTDSECAQKVVQIINSDALPPQIKLWVLSLMLSLVHPEKGLNPDTQAALMQTGLPRALCRLLVRTTTPPDQRVQALAMMRVLVNDPGTHALLVEAKVVPAIVKTIWEVELVNGRMVVTSSPTTSQSGSSAPPNSTWGVEQQMRQLACAMLTDLGTMQGHAFKAEILQAGAIPALAARLGHTGTHDQVRVACADALAALMEDGAIALEAARSDVLVGLVDMILSGNEGMVAAGTRSIRSLLTPTQPTSAATQRAALQATGSGNVKDVGGQADPGPGTYEVDQGAMLAAMGKAFTPSATAALMQLLHNEEMAPLALTLLPLSATDERCRVAIISDQAGMARMMSLAAANNADAAATLSRLAEDPKGGAQVAALLGKAVVDSRGDPRKAAAIADAIAVIGTPPAGLEKDGKAAGRAAAFAREVIEAGALLLLVTLVRASPDPRAKLSGVRALLPMCVYGEAKPTQAALLEADILMVLAEATHVGDAKLLVAAATALSGLTAISAETRARIFGILLGPLNSPDAAAQTCEAIRIVAGSSPDCYLEVERLGAATLMPRLVQLIAVPGAGALQPVLLLASLARYSPSAGEAAVRAAAVPALVSVMQGGDWPLRTAAAATVGFLVRHDDKACNAGDWPLRTAAAATVGFLVRHDDKARNAVATGGGLTALFGVARGAPVGTPWWDEAMVGLSSMATLHAGSRRDASDALYTMLKKGGPSEVSAACVVLSFMARGPAGRETILGDSMVELLVKVMASGTPDARAAAADTLGHLCTPSSVPMPNSEGKVVGVDPRSVCVNAGCVEHLVAMLAMPEESCVFEAAETLEILAPSAAAKTAVARAGGVDALNQVVLLGKRGKMSARTSKTAYSAYMLYAGQASAGGTRKR